MANKNAHKNARPFEPGDARINRKGRPKIPEELKHVTKLHKDLIEKKIAEFWAMSKSDLKAFCEDETKSAGDHMIASVCLKALVEGDHTRMNALLDRTIGRVKEVKEIILPTPTVIESIDGRKQLLLGDKNAIEEGQE